MKVAVLKELSKEEKRVALIPAHVSALAKAGLEIFVESNAGEKAGFSDSDYKEAGAKIGNVKEANIFLKVSVPTEEDLTKIKEGSTLISQLDPYFNTELLEKFNEKKLISFALEFIPRITRAQSMDVLSSMASIAGYKAVLAAAHELPMYFPMLMTAAGTIMPAKVFILGAGVAGLQAIATAKRLGAQVEAYDIRPVVKEQVESLGAKFVEFEVESAEGSGGYAKEQSEDAIKKQQELMTKKISEMDVVITTALIPGRKAPVLLSENMIRGMKKGSVIVDLATEKGGNVESSEKDQIVEKHGVKIIGYSDYPSRTAKHASQLFSKNISTFLLNMSKEGAFKVDMEDEIVAGSLITRDGETVNEKLKK